MDKKLGITETTGGYTEIVRSSHRQEEILKEFPWLWAISRVWPVPDEVKSSNDLDYLAKLLGLIPLDRAASLIYVKAYYQEKDRVLKFGERPTTLRSVEVPLPQNFQAKKIVWQEMVIRGLLDMAPPGMVIQNLVIRSGNAREVIVFRHPKGESFNQFLKSLL